MLNSWDIQDFPSPGNIIKPARLPANKTLVPAVPAQGGKLCARVPARRKPLSSSSRQKLAQACTRVVTKPYW